GVGLAITFSPGKLIACSFCNLSKRTCIDCQVQSQSILTAIITGKVVVVNARLGVGIAIPFCPDKLITCSLCNLSKHACIDCQVQSQGILTAIITRKPARRTASLGVGLAIPFSPYKLIACGFCNLSNRTCID